MEKIAITQDTQESVLPAAPLIKSKERVQKHGEVFTPDWMVKKMLGYPDIQEKLKDMHATFLEMQIPVLIKELSAPQILKIA